MPQLISPHPRVHQSFLSAMEEFAAEGRGGVRDYTTFGQDLRQFGAAWRDPAVFARYVEHVRAQAHRTSPRPRSPVPSTTLWYVEGDQYLGRLSIRHHLGSDFLREYGGHIGYDVRPGARRRGHATAMLRASLPVARDLGLESVLVTCDRDNTASRKVIESCGGVFEDQRGVKLRYWIDTVGEPDRRG